MKRLLIVGGNFDANGGRSSSLVASMADSILGDDCFDLTLYNGGHTSALHNEIYPSVKEYDAVFWFANVPNDEEKIRDVKAIHPKAILVNSKRNDNGKYTFAELISRSLSQKANLTVEFSKGEDGTFNMMLFDPLGNVYYNGSSVEQLMSAVLLRLKELFNFTRVPSIEKDGAMPLIPEETRFFELARGWADIFHNLIRPAKGTERFLGNVSFRCQNGFPSFRGDDGLIYVSRRNVNKGDICADSFVPVYLGESAGLQKDGFGDVYYYGEHKPSVDTPIQLRLYKLFPWANYMLHAHCYVDVPIDDGVYSYHTNRPIPCGAIEEVWEICETVGDIERINETLPRLLAINLKGHGCLLIARDLDILEGLNDIKDACFYSRPTPEYM